MSTAAVAILAAFMLATVAAVAPHAVKLFAPRVGRAHRICGALYLAWLAGGVAALATRRPTSAASCAAYDLVLGVLGALAALTAARDFGQHAVAETSGTLDAKAFVTRSEMVEHAFYQFLNLVQILGLHARANGVGGAAAVLALQTAPWLWRARVPVNSFSANCAARRV